MDYEKAKVIAEKYLGLLRPYCERIEIAGSIRRKLQSIKDIELVAIPKKTEDSSDFFDTEEIVHPEFVRIVNSLKKVRGDPTGKYTQRMLPEGIALDLFMASPENWGLIFAIRTGPANFSHKKLALRWVKKGYRSRNGMLHRDGIPVPVREENDLFRLLSIKYIDPVLRKR